MDTKSELGSGPIYSKINYDDAIRTKKKILMAQINVINSMTAFDRFKELRKKEFMLKIKLKNDLAHVGEQITRIINNSPKTEGIKKKLHVKHYHVHHDTPPTPRHQELSDQLVNIKERLNALG